METQNNQNNEEILNASKKMKIVLDEVKKRVIGQDNLIRNLLIAMLARGHVLLEGAPGLAKTLTVSTLSETLDTSFSRIQFTPDLLPSDPLGAEIYNQHTGEFYTKKGPLFANFVLADEINRAPSKVQSALLEAMQERQITIGDRTYRLDKPFTVLATQNPIEQEGTYSLPEAQLDRFLFKTKVLYPERSDEIEVMKKMTSGIFIEVENVLKKDEILALQNALKDVHVDDNIYEYVADIIFATRSPKSYGFENLENYIEHGASPRASLAFINASKALALMEGRDYVLPDDIRELSFDILRHRIHLSFEAVADDIDTEYIIDAILNGVKIR